MFVVTLPPQASLCPLSFARTAKKSGADILEIRSDLTPDTPSFRSPLPLLVTLREPNDAFLARFDASYVDCAWHPKHAPTSLVPPGAHSILSYHDYGGTSSLKTLQNIVQKMCSSKPWLVKIATTVQSPEDLLILVELRQFLYKKSVRFTVLGMGLGAGLIRILSARQDPLTYVCLDTEHASALGQLTLDDCRALAHGSKPRLYGILGGAQVSASLSPRMHNALFARHGFDAVYAPFPSQDFTASMRVLRRLGVLGLSVTAPMKREAAMIATTRDTAVQKLGVANTLLWQRKGWRAYNTDWLGIRDGYPALRRAKEVAILGAGGAVPAVIAGVRALCPTVRITVYARQPVRAEKELGSCQVTVRELHRASTATVDAVICAVSADVSLPLPLPRSRRSIALDLRYGVTTRFLAAAATQGYRVFDGTPMLVHQALAQYRLFTRKVPRPDDARLLTSLLSSRAR